MTANGKSREDQFVEVETAIANGRKEHNLAPEEENKLLIRSDELWEKMTPLERKNANKRCAGLYPQIILRLKES